MHNDIYNSSEEWVKVGHMKKLPLSPNRMSKQRVLHNRVVKHEGNQYYLQFSVTYGYRRTNMAQSVYSTRAISLFETPLAQTPYLSH
jgi:hypothetical protein